MFDKESGKTKREWLMEQSHEQLVTFIMNGDMTQDILREKLYLLAGCRNFGSSDGMDGSCVDCYHENRLLFNRCYMFGEKYRKHIKTVIKEVKA